MENTAIRVAIKEAIVEGLGAAVDLGALTQKVVDHDRRIEISERCNKELTGKMEDMKIGQTQANSKLDIILEKLAKGNANSLAWKIAIFGLIGSILTAIILVVFN